MKHDALDCETGFSDFYGSQSSFHKLLYSTGKWKDLFRVKRFESYISIIFSLFVTMLFNVIINTQDCNELTDLVRSLSVSLGVATLGSLGFIVSGLAITSGTIGYRVAKKIEKENKAEALIGILFSFYFVGFLMGILTVIYFIIYIASYINVIVSEYLFLSVAYIVSYLTIFSVLYCVSLLGTCLKMFLVYYKYSEHESSDTKGKDA